MKGFLAIATDEGYNTLYVKLLFDTNVASGHCKLSFLSLSYSLRIVILNIK